MVLDVNAVKFDRSGHRFVSTGLFFCGKLHAEIKWAWDLIFK